ncbi:MAG: hypothetical protein L0Y55_03625 [Anaerolineales bacterium]|nr:hypothetical protein [Anaerolineales bacterium]
MLITWVIWPIEFKNADPADLRPALKDDYVRMVSLAYEADGDIAVAQQRLGALNLANPVQTFTDLIEREIRNANDPATQDALIHLSHALGFKLPYTALRPPPTPRGGTTITITVVATPVSRVPVFKLVEHAQLSCLDEPESARLKFFVRDAAGNDLPNVAIQIRSKDLIETIYTGLKPERGIGYADYEAAPGAYAVTVLNSQSETIANLVIGEMPANCKADRGQTPRGWKLVFQQK